MGETFNFPEIQTCCKKLAIGKRLPTDLYLHRSVLPILPNLLQSYLEISDSILNNSEQSLNNQNFILIKINIIEPKVSYLYYPDFDIDPHPALERSIQVNLLEGTVQVRYYRDNPPILHRKETFVCSDYPLYQTFAELTQAEEKLGLLSDSRNIGHRHQWEKRLTHFRVRIDNHKLIEINDSPIKSPKIDRHKAAIIRRQMSRPVRSLFEANLLQEGMSFFDYGCGHGEDLKFILDKGLIAEGWDPHYKPDREKIAADVVNLGYVINVIENPAERREALVNA